MKVLNSIGGTRLIPLQHMVPRESARILLKLEYENPTGSMKDRMALAMVEAAEADGRLRPGGSVVEYTGGSTGVSLAFVCAAKRIPLQIVTSDAFSREKRDHMRALGARLTLVASLAGGMTKALTLEMIETARRLAMATARRLACEEGVFAGTSTGGNVAVALRVAARLGPDRTVVTVAVDSGMKYLSTALYAQT